MGGASGGPGGVALDGPAGPDEPGAEADAQGRPGGPRDAAAALLPEIAAAMDEAARARSGAAAS